MILTSNARLENTSSRTGAWLAEFTIPYYEFIDKKYEVLVASPKGGIPPIDPKSTFARFITAANRRFRKDKLARYAFKHSLQLKNARAEDYDAVFYPGGHGPLWDLAEDEDNAQLLLDFYRQEKPIAAVCHGPAALLKAASAHPELLQGKPVTGFSNTEEKLSGMSGKIPFKLEDRLKESGANYTTSTIPFTSNVQIAGNLITGQNPASAEKAARMIIKLLEKPVYKTV